MAPYNDKYCISCANRSQVRGVSFCKVKQCKRIPTKRQHVNAVEFIPEAGVLIVRTRYYSEVQEIILAHRDEDGRTFKEEKEVQPVFVNNPNYSPFDGSQPKEAICPACGYSSVYKLKKYCPNCGAKFLEDSEV